MEWSTNRQSTLMIYSCNAYETWTNAKSDRDVDRLLLSALSNFHELQQS